MDSSPTATKPTTPASTAVTSIGSPIVHESPFSNYLSNLSPIKPVTTLRVLQGYADLSSPLVFTSPHVVSKCEASSLQRPQCSLASSSETAKYNVGQSCVDAPPDLEKCGSYLSSKFNVVIQKDGDNSSYTKEQLGSSSEFVDEYLSEPVDKECGETVHSENQTTEPSVDPFGLANLQAILLSSDTDKEAPTFELPSTGQGSSNCAQTSDVLVCQTSLVQNMQAKDYYQHVGGLDDPEVSQLHRGMSRRCLQFEETQGIGQGAMPAMDSSNASSNQMGSIAPFSSVGMENSKMLNPGISAPCTKRKMINLTRGMISIHPPNQNAKATLSIPKRSGIGLHLNSIVKAFPKEYNANETMKSHLEESKGCSTELSNSVEKVPTPVGDRMVENQPAPAAVSATPDSMPFMKSLDVMQSVDPNETPHEKRTLSSEHSGSLNEFTQSSPKKKRKKFIPNGDGCKRCNCKKTKCLKLYCDCFAAGIYCADTCSCQGCFNRPEYEDTVLETRQLIESRNPLAFAPKIVHQSSILPPVIGEEVNRATPSSARHKRGCNCKRSMCLKKYCECYQANVGCSSGCRCEGCKNVYGRKDDYSASEEIMGSTTSKDGTKDIVDDNLTMVVHSDALLNTDSSDPQSPAPFTPQLQVFKHENGAPKSRPFSSRYLPSPLSDMSTFQSDATTTSSPTQTGDDNNLLADIDCQEMELTIAEMMGELSPKFDPIGDICCLSPQHNAPSSTAAGSPSAPRTMDSSTNVPRPEDGGGRGGLVSSSLRWHGSPVTPMPFSGKSKSQGDGKMSSEAHMREDEEEGEDTTPEILKEACNPIQSVKATSPNKKRVSPPYAPSKCLKLRSIASGGWKKGKFVLTGVPSFPPLTPCLEPKAPTKEQQEQGKSIRSVHCSRARESVSHKDCIVFESAHITGPWYIPEHRIVMQLWAVLWLLEEVVKFERCAAAFNISGRRRSPAI